MKNLYAKLGFIVAVVALFTFFALPVKEKIKLGLDLKGGMHLVLKVQTDDAIKIVTFLVSGTFFLYWISMTNNGARGGI